MGREPGRFLLSGLLGGVPLRHHPEAGHQGGVAGAPGVVHPVGDVLTGLQRLGDELPRG